MAVDGSSNSRLRGRDRAGAGGAREPVRQRLPTRRTLLRTESQAQRLIDPLAARNWLVVNPSVANALGQPVGYQLVPHGNVLPFAHEERVGHPPRPRS